MRNFKDIIIEKLKVTANSVKLPNLEDFGEALYKFNNAHKISFEDIDPKYRDIKNYPQYNRKGTLLYIVYLYVSVRTDGSKHLYAFCSRNESKVVIANFVVTSMDQLVEVLGEELVLQIWDYIK